jgi:hypothetical protein
MIVISPFLTAHPDVFRAHVSSRHDQPAGKGNGSINDISYRQKCLTSTK